MLGVKIVSLDHELEKAQSWCEEIALYLSPEDASRLGEALQTLRRLADSMVLPEPVLIHKDFYYAHVLWDGSGICVIDFDQLSTGDPAFDAGHFAAHLENLAYRATGDAQAYAGVVALFVQTYEQEAGVDVAPRLPFYRAYTFLKLAATEVSRHEAEWQPLTRALTELACRELERSGAIATRRE